MKSWVILPALCVSVSVWSQSCVLPLEKSAPDERFELDPGDSGIVMDLQTGLSWQRCSVGFELDDANTSQLEDDVCQLVDQNPEDGVADNNDSDFNNDVELTYSWYGAFEYADEFAQTVVGTGWRLPNLKELASLVETACFSPALNSHVFPNAAQADYWSSTPHAVTDSSAWTISFSVGEDSSITKSTNAYVLLVRD